MRRTADAPDVFAAELSRAMDNSGLTLDRVRHRLAQRGVRVSLSTLSYWRRGRSRPERAESIRAVRALEDVLTLPKGSLLALLGPPRPRGRWVHVTRPATIGFAHLWTFDVDGAAPALDEVARPPAERLTYLSIHDELHIGADGQEDRLHIRSVVRADAPGVDRIHIIHRPDATDRDVPRITSVTHGRRGRVHFADGFLNADILLDRVLREGETAVVEYEIASSPGTLSAGSNRRFTRPVPHYLLQVDFHPDAMPARCAEFHRAGPDLTESSEHELWIGASGGAHAVALDAPPGIIGIRWEWD